MPQGQQCPGLQCAYTACHSQRWSFYPSAFNTYLILHISCLLSPLSILLLLTSFVPFLPYSLSFQLFLSFLLLIPSALKICSTKNKKKISHFKPKSACLAYFVFILFLAQACIYIMVVLGTCQRPNSEVIRFLQIKPI